ncbi:MAG: anthranilate synthase component I family protein [Thermodesulfovibrionales bacterium]|nr:anthranilate synthase component I family protein [Thermodesulfovibrionales bacterium]
MVIPPKKDFMRLIKTRRIPPLYEEIPYFHPYLIYESLASPNSFLLESIKGPIKIARYSFIGFDPYLIFKVKNGLIEIETSGEAPISHRLTNKHKNNPPNGGKGGFERSISKQENKYLSKPLNVLKELVNSCRQRPFEYLPPFQGGAVGVLSYDFVQYLERLPKFAIDDINLPDAHLLMIDKLVAIDHLYKKCWIIVCPGARDTEKDWMDWSEKYDKAEYEIKKILKKVTSRNPKSDPPQADRNPKSERNIEIIYEMKKEDYMDIVRMAKEYIAAGDIFQANLSQRVSAHIGDISPWSLYRILSLINPSPFAAFMDFGDYQIVSSSPERLLRVKDGIVETRPIAGTRPRGKDSKEDELMRSELLLNEKERAEHIMLIDLERNDLGRVSDYGTVRVDEFMITEDYSHVIHIVSNVRGNLADGKDCFDAIKAAFPGGTITGVPKVRCMEIIDELEPVRRGPYTGSAGYISFSGNMDLNIVIRTFVIKGGMAYVQVGAGIVADSDPEREYYETLKKAEALIKTLEGV